MVFALPDRAETTLLGGRFCWFCGKRGLDGDAEPDVEEASRPCETEPSMHLLGIRMLRNSIRAV